MKKIKDHYILSHLVIFPNYVFNVRTGAVIARVWNQTVAAAEAVNKEQFEEACRQGGNRYSMQQLCFSEPDTKVGL